ncbi:MAG TPA: CcdB family protein [Burkholderiaceae bacterium]|jgi:toxin CcdB|nr:CcdB family protein [Burkholderiaceae bacterium]
MSQFDVHRNPGINQTAIPYVVVVQSAAFDKLGRRLVIPLLADGDRRTSVRIPHSDTTPIVTVKGRRLVLNPFEMVSVDVRKLGAPVASLANAGDAIIAALDEVLSRAWG